jgi:hypothetical protein
VRGVAGPRLADLIVKRRDRALDGRGPGHVQAAGIPGLPDRGGPAGAGLLDRLASAGTRVVEPRGLTPARVDRHEHQLAWGGESGRRGSLRPQRLADIVGCPNDPIAAAPDDQASPVPELHLGGPTPRARGGHGAAGG